MRAPWGAEQSPGPDVGPTAGSAPRSPRPSEHHLRLGEVGGEVPTVKS